MGNYLAKRINLSDITLNGEIWKDIPQTDNNYKVSSLGRVYSNISEHLLSLKPHKTYRYVCLPLIGRGNRNSYRVHRLVAQAFIPNPFNKKEVNHKNKNRSDNRVENLEWSTAMENTHHKYGVGFWHKEQGRITPTDYSVAERKIEGFAAVIHPMIHKLVPLNG
jgi:hypothetical protein